MGDMEPQTGILILLIGGDVRQAEWLDYAFVGTQQVLTEGR